MLDGTVLHIDLALIQQIMVPHRYHIHAQVPGILHLIFNPVVRLLLNHAADLIIWRILARIQHQRPVIVINLIYVAERRRIAAHRFIISEILVNLREVLRADVSRSQSLRSCKLRRRSVVDIVIPRDHNDGDLLQLPGEIKMAVPLTVQG